MIIKDLQPISIVEDIGFKELIRGLEPSYDMPSRTTFTNSFLNQKYEQKKEKLKVLLSKAASVSLTSDAWTAQHSQTSYICYTAHFITDDWKLYSCLLECGQYNESHTAHNLKEEFLRVANDWSILKKICTVTTDNAANVKAAVNLTEWGHIGCFAHTINLIVQSGLDIPQVAALRTKVKQIVQHFHKSTKNNNKFLSMQKQMDESSIPLKLINDVVTRWNSTYYMFNRILKVKEPLSATLGVLNSPVDFISEADWVLLQEICTILKPFEQITTEMSAEKNITLSKVIILVKGLRSAMEKVSQLISANSTAKSLITHYEKEISKRFSTVESNNLMAKCSLLDPRFKSKVFSSEQNFITAKERLENEVARLINLERRGHDINNETIIDRTEDTTESAPSDQEEDLIWGDFDRAVKRRKQIDGKAAAIIEIKCYLAEDLIYRKEDPLEWWKARSAIYPYLAKLAKQCLAIVATSVPSERIFSTAGQIVSERRSRLKGQNVQKILFLHSNQNL